MPDTQSIQTVVKIAFEHVEPVAWA